MTEQLPAGELAIRAIAMPADANPHGDIFGGWLLSQMDLAGATVATRRARGRIVTVAIATMTFKQPVFVGDEVSCYAKIVKTGEHLKVTEGVFTYVAVDDNRRPRPLPAE
jgi:acyl-CoA thioesterase YciA